MRSFVDDDVVFRRILETSLKGHVQQWLSRLFVFFEQLLFHGVITNSSCFEVVADLQRKVEVRKGSGSAFFHRRDLMDVTFKSELVYVDSRNCNSYGLQKDTGELALTQMKYMFVRSRSDLL